MIGVMSSRTSMTFWNTSSLLIWLSLFALLTTFRIQSCEGADSKPVATPTGGSTKLVNLDAKCGAEAINVKLKFDKPFNGIIYSKGAFYTPECVYVLPGTGETDYVFDIPISKCETTEIKATSESRNGEHSFENTIVMQNDAHFQDMFDVVRKIKCSTASKYERVVDFSPLNVNMKDVVTASFTGDDVKVSIDIQNGHGPFAPSINQGFVQIGDTLTLIVYMTSGQAATWDLQIRECVALDSKERVTLQLQDKNGCVTKPKILSNFVTTQDRKNPNMLVAYSYLKAFRFPDDMQVQIRCVVAVCRDECRKTTCNGGDTSSSRNANDTSSSDEDEEVITTTVTSSTVKPVSSSSGIFGQTVKQRGAFEKPSNKSQFRRKRQADSVPAGTLPLRHVFNVISPEDIQNLRNSSVVFVDSAVPANSVCVNQAMLILLLCFLMAVVLAVSVALTLVCLRNKALRRSKLIEMYPQ